MIRFRTILTAAVAMLLPVPEVVISAGTSSVTDASPFIVRTGQVIPQTATTMAQWALQNGIKKVVSVVSDYGPGIDGEKWFDDTFKAGGGTVVDALRIPLA